MEALQLTKLTKPTKLTTLPIEVRQAILSELPDVQSLRCAALSCLSLFKAFTSSEHLITGRVLLSQVPRDVLPEAVAALHSAWVSPWPRVETQEFVAKHFFTRKAVSRKWSLKNALAMTKLHDHIRYFADRFCEEALATDALKGSREAPTRSEVARIERALYRFQIYCNLFPGLKRPLFDASFQKALYFNKFAPWENEQLAAVHDFLHRSVCPVFNDIAEHDVAWGEFWVEYVSSRATGSGYIQPLLARGLPHVRRLVTASSYTARYALLGHAPDWISEFVHEALLTSNDPDDGVRLREYARLDELRHITPPFFAEENDRGAERAWRWAHERDTCIGFVNSGIRRQVREWGYVFWDEARLHRLGVLSSPWQLPDEDPPVDYTEMRRSHDRRSQIYMAGGRGWWSWEDESKVVWPNGRGELPKILREPREVKSLEEAKALIASLRLPAIS